MRERVERMAADLDLVTREEFDAVRAMAAKARAGQEELEGKLARLQADLAGLEEEGFRGRRTQARGRQDPVRKTRGKGEATSP